jgi:hypothetical protein
MASKAAARGIFVLLGLLLLLTACVHLAGAQASVSCKTADVFSLPDVVRPCCESMPSGDCSGGFPTDCSVTCATEIVPLWQLCGETAMAFPDDTFDGFSVAACAPAPPLALATLPSPLALATLPFPCPCPPRRGPTSDGFGRRK